MIGTEDETGDPIFVDTRSPEWPVYTAMHGEGAWEPERIANSFARFVAALELIRGVADGRDYPVALEQNPLPAGERARVLSEIARGNPGAELGFWETWLDA